MTVITPANNPSDDNAQLIAFTQSLTAIVESSEDDFISLGMNLQKVQMLSSAQRQKISATMGLFKADGDSGILQKISAYVKQSQYDTKIAQEDTANLCTDLTAMTKLLDEVDKKGAVLERSGLLLHVIGVQTGIECAREQQMAATFKVVSSDTIGLASKIKATTNSLSDTTAMAKSTQQQTLSTAKKSIDALHGLAQESDQATTIALSKVAELVDYSISVVDEAEQMSVTITGEINQVVMGVQFHDNLRQRIEHINEALQEIETTNANLSAEDSCNRYLSVELQKIQLENLIIELEVLYATQAQALDNIIHEITGLESRLESMVQEQESANAKDDPVAVLLAGISSLEQLNQDSLVLGQTISSSAKQAELIVADMRTAIKSTFVVANNVKINALNAIIKAAKFGQAGEALQVLAQGMVEVSKETRSLIQIFDGLLAQLVSLAQGQSTTVIEHDGLVVSSGFDSQQVQQVFSEFRNELLNSKHDCNTLVVQLVAEQQHLVFISELKDALQQRCGLLSNYTESIRPQDEELLAKMRGEFGKHLEGRYTMKEERDIHAQMRQELNVVAPAVASTVDDDGIFFDQPVATASATADVDLWGDDPAPVATDEVELWGDEPVQVDPNEVELWGDDPAPATTDDVELWGDETVSTGGDVELFDTPVAPAVSNDADIELWGDTPDSSSEVETNPDDKNTDKNNDEDFGDNVDLF